MSLSAGARIGVYEIQEPIGSGGMGEVYRAIDSKLRREVAIKVLPAEFAADADRMARFQREAQVLASLSHPNIASVYGLEEAGTTRALVMELVEGEDLAVRLRRGPLALDEALRIALQVAEALEAAHERGIIHRDLKPANVKVAPDGRVKVLDFGLAKTVAAPAGDPSHSPTLSIAATQAGLILGTAGYMSPEQASGRAVDRRADVWAFGVLCFELLSGRRLFQGETVTHTLADVLRAEIEWTRLPASTPVAVRHLLERCLERDPRRRLRDIGEARIVLEEQLTRAHGTTPTAGTVPPPRPGWRRALLWGAGLLCVAGVVAGVLAVAGVLRVPQPPAASPPMILEVALGDEPLFTDVGAAVALSDDGTRFVYVTERGERQILFVRPLHQADTRTLVEGTGQGDSPYHPFFSPDGQWVGYVTSSELRKVPVTGGSSITLTRVTRSRGATWLPDDTIVFAAAPNMGLSRIPAAGGEPVPLTALDASRQEATHRWPQALPGGRAVLFTSHIRTTGRFEDATIEVVTVDTRERKVIHRGGSFARYLPSGHLVFVRRGTLFAMPFDAGRLEALGSPTPVLQDVGLTSAEGAAQLAMADTGLLVYRSGETDLPTYPIVWVDRDGTRSRLVDQPGTYAHPRLSPDGRRLALTVLRDDNWDIWIHDLERDVSTRLTLDEAADTDQVWSPDGRTLLFSSDRTGNINLFRQPADGSREAEQLTSGTTELWATSWSPDGRVVLAWTGTFDIVAVFPEERGRTEPLLTGAFAEGEADFSPDGKWVAYMSSESGRDEIYVRPFDGGGGRWQISDGGGSYPRWARDGRELFYRTDTGIMVVSVEPAGPALQTGRPRLLVSGDFQGGDNGIEIGNTIFADYDVSPDGQRFVMFPAAAEEQNGRTQTVRFVTSWFDQLRRLVPGGRADAGR